MSIPKIIFLLIAGQILIFGIGWIIGHLIKTDKYLNETQNQHTELKAISKNGDSEEE